MVIHTRKLCSCNALLALSHAGASSSAAAAAAEAPVPDTSLFGVILLNSPASTEDDFAAYIRLFQQYRSAAADAVQGPYFICADGAYAALRRYCATHHTTGQADSDANSAAAAAAALRLSDALIGDMDSLSAAQLTHVAAAAAAAAAATTSDVPESTTDAADDHAAQPPLFHADVAAIPTSLLEAIRRRRDAYAYAHRTGAAASPLVVLPVSCQMTTDFQKCVALLQRLHSLEHGAAEVPMQVDGLPGADEVVPLAQQSREAAALAAEYEARLPETSSTAAVQAGEDQQEAARCQHLLDEMSTSATNTTPSTAAPHLVTRVLPNVAVFGALGGRVDHEIGVMCCLLRYARVFHVMVINKYNVLFACWPDGVTQLVLPPQWSPPSPAPGATAAPYMCGIIPFGVSLEMETTGFLWNVVKGRPDVYDGYTQTSGYRLAFDGLVSACNTVTSPIVTIDVRPLRLAGGGAATWLSSLDPDAPSMNPPTLFTLGRPGASSEFHPDLPTAT
ncbi:thiamine pyrophosphokinase, vitamin B1 binding domain containing protein [Novymonas esmeraldas]|uniref:Thiamine pyrophosphokinase, vitamin B1 binding domain containing protein n=1 Tax=Novymonas esmeraldas TaxID=1808958 RepID=A0AAW0EVS1_9TRYP